MDCSQPRVKSAKFALRFKVPGSISSRHPETSAAISPDSDALRGRQIQRLSRLHVEGAIPRIDITYCICAILAWRVRIGHHLLAQCSFTRLFSPVLCESEK